MLATLAAVLGIALSVVATKTLLSLGARFMPGTLLAGITLDWRVLAFALIAALVTSFIFGIAPAWQATRVDLQDALKQGGTRGQLGGGSSRLRNGLVVAQVAVSLMLAVGAGLLFRTLLALQGAELGYRSEGILVAYANMPARTPREHEQAEQFFEQLTDRLRQLPHVTSAAVAPSARASRTSTNIRRAPARLRAVSTRCSTHRAAP